MKIPPPRKGNSPIPSYHPVGSIQVTHSPIPTTPVSLKPVNVSEYTQKISPVLDSSLECLEMPQQESLTPNGTESSEEKFLTSTTSSPLSIALQLMKRERLALETQKSALESLTQRGVLALLPNGFQHGNWQPKQSNSLSLTVPESSSVTVNSSQPNLQLNSPVLTRGSSFSTLPSRISYKEGSALYSPTNNSTCVSIRPFSCLMESSLMPPRAPIVDQVSRASTEAKPISAIDSTALMVAHHPTPIVITATSARNARKRGMGKTNAPSKSYQDILGARPRYLRYNLWDSTAQFTPTIADWSETAIPLPSPPISELEDPIVKKTISENPELFRIVTPINVDHFQFLLSDHPNPLFVDSVCRFAERFLALG
jgi:hypothetical protein